MSVSRIVLAVAFATSLATSMTVAQSAEPPSGPDCGWVLRNGTYVFIGTCPDQSGDASSPDSGGGGGGGSGSKGSVDPT